MKKLWICGYALLVAVMVSPLYLSWLFPAAALANAVILTLWVANAGTDCMNYYNKSYMSIVWQEGIEYRKLVRKKIKRKEDFPLCLRELSACMTCWCIFFGSVLLHIVLRFLLKLW